MGAVLRDVHIATSACLYTILEGSEKEFVSIYRYLRSVLWQHLPPPIIHYLPYHWHFVLTVLLNNNLHAMAIIYCWQYSLLPSAGLFSICYQIQIHTVANAAYSAARSSTNSWSPQKQSNCYTFEYPKILSSIQVCRFPGSSQIPEFS